MMWKITKILIAVGSALLIFGIIINWTTDYPIHYVGDVDAVAKTAVEKKDPSICSKVHLVGIGAIGATNDEIRANCYWLYAEGTLDPSYCFQLGYLDSTCVSNIALLENDPAPCFRLTDNEVAKYDCVSVVAAQRHDITLCKSLDDPSLESGCRKAFPHWEPGKRLNP